MMETYCRPWRLGGSSVCLSSFQRRPPSSGRQGLKLSPDPSSRPSPSSVWDGNPLALGRKTWPATRSSLVGLVISCPFQWRVAGQGSLCRTEEEEFLEEDTGRTLSRSWVPGKWIECSGKTNEYFEKFCFEKSGAGGS